MAIEAQRLEIQIGARTLLHPTDFHVAKGDKIGLVGRNGAGKTTLTRVITGDMLPTSGKVRVSGKLGYLPQDTHAADQEQTALDRMMSARDIASIISRIRKAEKDMTNPDPDIMTKAMNRYDKAMQDFDKAGGYAAQSEAIAMADSLGLPQDVMQRPLGTLSGGQRRRIELARILFSDADTLILDEPTNHLDADSIEWLRGFLKKYEGGFLVISHSTELLDEVVNKVWHLDAQTGQIDMYSLGWKAYLHQRVVDEERRRREREVAEKKADRLMKQGIRLHAKATKAVAAQNMMRRAERLLSETSDAQKQDKVADIRFPEPAPCGRTPIMAKDISKAYGSNIVFAGVNLAVDKAPASSSSATTAPEKPPPCACSPTSKTPTPASSNTATAARSATSPRSTTPSISTPPCLRTSPTSPLSSTTLRLVPSSAPSSSPATTPSNPPGSSPAAKRPVSPSPRSSPPAPTSSSSTSPPTTSTPPPATKSSRPSPNTKAPSSSSPTTRAQSRP